MTSSKLVILDVGHGSCAVFVGDATVVIDTGIGGTLVDFLRSKGIRRLDFVFISHADQDHIGGLIGLLAEDDITVVDVYLNPDADRSGKIWEDLKSVFIDARNKRGTRIVNGLSTTIPGTVNAGHAIVEVVAPASVFALSGVGGTSKTGEEIKAHSLNAVIRIRIEKGPAVLLTGDLDSTGLDNIISESTNINADFLVFPHHGGFSGKNSVKFAQTICKLVQPRTVVFSIGRGKHNTPQPEIINAIRSVVNVHIACTQLSTRCANTVPTEEPSHLASEVARGREKKFCCAGTLVVSASPMDPKMNEHIAFVRKAAPNALCQIATTPAVARTLAPSPAITNK